MKEQYKLKIEPITAVHIGSGNKLTPLDYRLVETKSGKKYFRFSSDSILQRIASDKQLAAEFENASIQGNVKAIQSFFHKNSKSEDGLYFALITKEFEYLYNEKIKGNPLDNAIEVDEQYKPEGSSFPVIPGSSLKGAIRTAIVNTLINNLSDDKFYRIQDFKSDKIQQEVLGQYKDAKEDPFRAVQIGDCTFTERDSQIVGSMKMIGRNAVEKNGSQILAEAISGQLLGKSSYAEATLRIDSQLVQMQGVKKSIGTKDIIKSCNDFYIGEFNSEYEDFYKNARANVGLIKNLYSEINKEMPDNQFIIRVGRWSQFEFVTFPEGIRQAPSKGAGKTRTVFNYDGQYLPMGWCRCTVVN